MEAANVTDVIGQDTSRGSVRCRMTENDLEALEEEEGAGEVEEEGAAADSGVDFVRNATNATD